MLHIVFKEADIDVLQKAIELDESLNGEIIQVKDDFAVGPIENIFTEDANNNRLDWWKQVLEFSPHINEINFAHDKIIINNIISKLNENQNEEVWIWMADNQHDVCSYYWLIIQLKDFLCRIQILHLHNLPFINEKGNIFYPFSIHEIQPKELLKAKRLARFITTSEYELDSDEWEKLCKENGLVRILEGAKKIVTKDVTYYDKELLGMITGEFQKLQKILNTIYSKTKIKTGDVFLAWRIRELIKDGKLESQGDWNKGWKEILIKHVDASSINYEASEQNPS